MTISSNLRKAGPFAGNAATTAFPFAYKVFTASDVVVTKSDGITETTLVLTTDYTVALNADQNANPGGTVTYPASGSPLPVGQTLTLSSFVPELQQTSITTQGGFYPKIIEDALDRLTIFVQQFREILGRSLRFPVSDPTLNITLPTAAQRANKVLGFDGNGAVATYSASSAVTDAGSVNYVPVSGPTAGISVTVQTWLDRLLTAGASLGAALVGYLQAGVGAVSRTVQDKLRETVSVKDFGAVGDGSTDDYAAIIAAYNAVSAGAMIYVPSGTYKFLTAPVFGTKRVAWVGDGARQSIFNYAGANTTNDCFTWGDGISEVNGIRMSGIGFSSSTVMTDGAGVRFKLLSRSTLRDVEFSHQDGTSNFYHGAWFDGCDLATVDGFQARAQQDGIRVNGAPGSATVGVRADLFLSNGKIGKCAVGLHVGGAFGGLYVDATDIIGNLTNLLIDKTINTFGNNRECMFGAFCALDGAGTSALPFSGINLDIQDSGGFIFFSSPWIASASTLIRIGAAFTGVLKLDGGFLYNAFNTAGGAGNGIEIGNTVAQVQVNGTRVKNINGTAFTCSAGVTTQTNIINPVFESDVTAKYNTNVRPLPQVVKGRFVAGGGDANFAAAVDGNPAQTFYQGGNYGGAAAIGFFGNNASGGWLEFAKSRGATPGAQGIITSGDSIGGLNFSASDGVSFISTANIKVVNTGTPAVGDIASRMIFATRPAGGALTDRAWFLETGNFAPVSDNSISLGISSLAWSNTYSRNFRPGTGAAIWTSGAGSPEAVVTAPVGSLYTNTSGGAGTTLYVKETGSGNTGWVVK